MKPELMLRLQELVGKTAYLKVKNDGEFECEIRSVNPTTLDIDDLIQAAHLSDFSIELRHGVLIDDKAILSMPGCHLIFADALASLHSTS